MVAAGASVLLPEPGPLGLMSAAVPVSVLIELQLPASTQPNGADALHVSHSSREKCCMPQKYLNLDHREVVRSN